MAAYDRSPGDLIAGKYRIVGMLGQGGMGSVYDAVNDWALFLEALGW